LHLGKTGGKTSREVISLLKDEKLKRIYNMPDHHFNIAQYENKYNDVISDKKVILGFRRLIDWMPSFHMQMYRNLKDYKKYASKGKVRFRDGRIVLPDEILSKYIDGIKDITFIRLENMYDDFHSFFGSRVDNDKLKKICSKKVGQKNYKKPILSEVEILNIYEKNPIWAEIEKRIYK
jgi:hypothetical protein